nr:acyloxyacyl hydrolase [Allomuricauda sp.]
MKKIAISLFGSLLFAFNLYPQSETALEESRPIFLGVSLDYGYLLKHSESLRQIDDSFPFAIRLDASKQLLTKKAWEFCNCFPKVGVSLAYWDWDNPDVLGIGVVAVGYVEPYFYTDKRVNLFARMGLGGAYLTQPFDEEENPLNQSYSTDLAFSLVFGTGINYRVNDQLNLRLAAKYSHISNGGVSTPNKGLNYPTVSIGVSTSLDPVNYPSLARIVNRDPPTDKSRLSLEYFSGYSNATVGDRDKFYVFGFAGKYSRWIGRRSALTVGAEWLSDLSRRELIELEGEDVSFQQVGLLAGHEFWLGKITFSQQLGVYVINQFRITDDVYQRYGLTYNFNKRIFAGVNVKAHRHVADFFDVRIGYTF